MPQALAGRERASGQEMSDVLLERLRAELPVSPATHTLAGRDAGLVIANATATACAADGTFLAEHALPARALSAIAETERLARRFLARRQPVLAFVDQRPTPRQPATALAWLQDDPDATLLRKDCVSGFVGAIEAVHHGQHGTSHNRVVDWVNAHRLDAVLVAGLGTDVCVMELVLALLSARAHGMMPTLREVVVVEPATATYDLPLAVAGELGLPASAAHPEQPTHHLGLYVMAARGALIAASVDGV